MTARRIAYGLLVFGIVAGVLAGCAESTPAGDVNRAPEVSLRGDFTARLGHLVPVVASGSDADGDGLTFSWDFLSVPLGAVPTLGVSGGHIVVLSTDTAGEYELRVVVDDGEATSSDVVEITFDPAFELDPWAVMSASPYVIPEVASVNLPDPATGEPILTEVAVLAGFVVQGGDLVLGRLDQDFDVAPTSFVRESAAFPTSVIPYEFVIEDFSTSDRNKIKLALDVLAAETVLTFEDVTGKGSSELRIRFERDGMNGRLPGCWAEKNFLVAPGVRVVNLGSSPGECMSERIIKHEVLHALGFYHEHQRRDRNSHVDVWITNPGDAEAWASYLLNYDIPLDGRASGAYDWLSIMHYPFRVDRHGIGMQPKTGALPDGVSDDEVGLLTRLSDGDIYAINSLYGTSMLGRWTGSYTWYCREGSSGSAPLELEITSDMYFPDYRPPYHQIDGVVRYLGSEAEIIGGRCASSAAVYDEYGLTSCHPGDPFGDVLYFYHSGSSSFVNNSYSGRVRDGRIAGTTINGDSPTALGPGCSHADHHAGEFELVRTGR